MSTALVVSLIVATIAVVTIAAVSMLWVTRRLATTEKSAIFDIDQAVTYVADRLPPALAGQLSYDDVEMVILWYLDFLRNRGFATYGESDVDAQNAAVGGRDVVATEEEAVDSLLATADKNGRGDLTELDVVAVVDLTGDYLDRIGAFGHRRILGMTVEEMGEGPRSTQ